MIQLVTYGQPPYLPNGQGRASQNKVSAEEQPTDFSKIDSLHVSDGIVLHQATLGVAFCCKSDAEQMRSDLQMQRGAVQMQR